jgi:hypothetical protein
LAPIEAGKPFMAAVRIVNTGKTPALKITSFIRIAAAPANQSPDVDAIAKLPTWGPDETTSVPTGAFFPGQVQTLLIGHVDSPIPTDTLNGIISGTLTVYIIGEIHYRDVFNSQHMTTFFMVYNPEAKAFAFCPTHNDAD